MTHRLLAALLLSATLASAGAIYSTTVSSEFFIGHPVSVTPGPTLPSIVEAGTGDASFGGVLSPAGVLPATKLISVSGIAPFPISLASSSFQAGHLFTIDNSAGSTPVLLAFTFSYGYTVTLDAAGPGDYAEGGAFFHITGIDNEILTIGGLPAPEYLFQASFSTLLGGTGGAGGDVITGGIAVPAFTVSVFSVVTDTAGLAYSVPEPAAASMAIAGLLALTLLRARRPASPIAR